MHAMKSQQLVPGDVIVVQTGQAVCDMVLLQGNALTEESRLTGQVSISFPCSLAEHVCEYKLHRNVMLCSDLVFMSKTDSVPKQWVL